METVNQGHEFYIDLGGILATSYCDEEYDYGQIGGVINYCPMCGEDLSK